MKQRMIKSNEEIELIKNGSKVADVGARALIKKIKVGVKEIEVAHGWKRCDGIRDFKIISRF